MMPWLEKWRATLVRALSLLGAFASLVGVTASYLPPISQLSGWSVFFLTIPFLIFIGLLIPEIRTNSGVHIYKYTDSTRIKWFMRKWISSGGRVAIWSRDLSWVDDEETQNILLEKARRKEIIICLPQHTSFTRKLEDEGAEICPYGSDTLETPTSRFTIAFFGRDGSKVAFGRTEGDYHVIREVNASQNPSFYVAQDLIEFARRSSSNE